MPSKKKKYNARFPAGRIKKIMQSDEEIGKVAQAVPVIISRTLELFVESLLTKTVKITNSRNAKTLSTSHMKQCIMSEQRFDFLRELVRNIPDISVAEEASNYNEEDAQSSPEETYPDSDTPYDLSMPSTSARAIRGGGGGGSSSSSSGQLESNYNGGEGHSTARVSNRQHLKRGISTVIMHTNAVAQEDDCVQGTKYMRSDSTPVGVVSPPRQRLKHQPQSLPIHNNNNNNNNYNNNGSGNYHYNTTECSPSKRSRITEKTATQTHTYTSLLAQSSSTPASTIPPPPSQQQQLQKQPQTAIPAPIVSIDFRNKPIVKIDYSNLPMPTAATVTAPLAPHSAPTHIGGTQCDQSAFNFSAEPVINIDLTNIVTTNTNETPLTATTTKSAAANGAASTISIIKSDPLPTLASSTSDVNPKSKVTMQAPFNTNTYYKSVPAVTASAAAAAGNKDSFFELDEDYDDI